MTVGDGRPPVTDKTRPVSDEMDFSSPEEDSFDLPAQAGNKGAVAEGPQNAPGEGVLSQVLTSALPGEACPAPFRVT